MDDETYVCKGPIQNNSTRYCQSESKSDINQDNKLQLKGVQEIVTTMKKVKFFNKFKHF